MNIKELLTKNRSYRRFYSDHKISREQLIDMIELTRLTASAANLQPLKYKISYETEMNEKIFSTLKWAGYLTDWIGPVESERPTGYIVVLNDKTISKTPDTDIGIISQAILLRAVEIGLGGCMFGAIDRAKLSSILNIKSNENLEIKLVIALGKPKEEVRLVKVKENKSIKYYRNEDNTHFVPKRGIEEILI